MERNILDCRSSSWTIAIGWFNVVGNIIALVVLVTLMPEITANVFNKNENSVHLALTWIFVFLVVLHGFTFLGSIYGVVLLLAVYYKNPGWLRIWIFYAYFCMTIAVVFACVKCCFARSLKEMGVIVLGLFVGLVIKAHCVWAVRTYKKELEDQGRVDCSCMDDDNSNV